MHALTGPLHRWAATFERHRKLLQVREAFQRVDDDESGTLDRAEVARFLRALLLGTKLATEQVRVRVSPALAQYVGKSQSCMVSKYDSPCPCSWSRVSPR